MARTHLLSSLVLVALAGCPDREVSRVNPHPDKVEQKEIPLTINRKIDILFVVDNSGSMKEEQATLAQNFPTFIDVLQQIDGGLPDVHLGVVSSDMGALGASIGGCTSSEAGNLQTGGQPAGPSNTPTPICSMVAGNYISDILNPMTMMRVTNYTGTLNDAFSCLAVGVGDHGCGFEAHLESMKAALDNNPVNAGFLRQDAYLAVIVIADEDDCSAANPNFFGPESAVLGPVDSFRCFEKAVRCNEGRDTALRAVGVKTGCVVDDTQTYLHDVQDYVSFLKSLKADPRSVIVAGIVGNSDPVEVQLATPMGAPGPRPDQVPSCTYVHPVNGAQSADPGIRLRAFFESFPDRNTSTTICDNNYDDALNQIAELLRTVIGYPCIAADLVDKDPTTPALDPDCQFSYITRPGEIDEHEVPLPACDAGLTVQPCWHLVEDAMQCMNTPTNLMVVVEDPGTPPPDTFIRGGCVVQ